MNEAKTETQQLISLENVNDEMTVSFQPAKLEFHGYDEMKAKVDELHAQLDGYKVTPQTYKSDKALRTKISKFRQQINDEKKRVVNEASKPITVFKGQVKSMTSELDDIYNQIGSGLTYYDNKVKQYKHNRNIKRISEFASQAGLTDGDLRQFNFKYNQRWDNKSYSNVSFENEVSQQLEVIVKQQATYLDGVKQISQKADELALPVQHWIDELKIKPVSDILVAMDNHAKELKQVVEDKKRRQEEFAKQQAEDAQKRKLATQKLEKHGDKLIDPDTGEVKQTVAKSEPKIYEHTFVVSGTSEQLTSLASFFRENKIAYKVVD